MTSGEMRQGLIAKFLIEETKLKGYHKIKSDKGINGDATNLVCD